MCAEPFSAWNKVVARVTVECLYLTLHQTGKNATESSQLLTVIFWRVDTILLWLFKFNSGVIIEKKNLMKLWVK